MPQVQELIDFFERYENKDIRIAQEKCVKVRNRNAKCSACMDACPVQCLAYAQNKLYFQNASCASCGACVTVCPTGVFELVSQKDSTVVQQALSCLAQTDGHAVIACESVINKVRNLIDTKRLSGVHCLAYVDVSVLLRMYAAGARKITLVCDACENCQFASCKALIDKTIQTFALVMQTWNQTCECRSSAKFPGFVRKENGEEFDESKRSFFTGIRSDARSLAANSANYAVEKVIGPKEEESTVSKIRVNEVGTLPTLSNARRTAMIKVLDTFGTPQDVMIATGLWSQVEINLEQCRACRMCATFCPTGALFKFHTKSGKIGVKQIVRDCVNCRCCEDVCLSHVLSLSNDVFAVDIADGREERFEMEAKKKEQKFTFN